VNQAPSEVEGGHGVRRPEPGQAARHLVAGEYGAVPPGADVLVLGHEVLQAMRPALLDA
jgi:hypothetical protein